YHVADILQEKEFAKKINGVVLAAKDFAGIKGTKDILSKWGIDIDVVTGPIANSEIGIELIGKYFSIIAESNQQDAKKTYNYFGEKIFRKKGGE
ncbi:MAG: hypothetical protein ACREGI_00285, partial [Candidatus Levyibacteriota bacterium]